MARGLARFGCERDDGEHDVAAALPSDHLPLSETATVAHTPHLVLDGLGGVAGKEEMSVQRATDAIADRPARRDQALRQELAAEDARARALDAPAFEVIVVERREVQRFEERRQGIGHLASAVIIAASIMDAPTG
jgi:hypothetical protein